MVDTNLSRISFKTLAQTLKAILNSKIITNRYQSDRRSKHRHTMTTHAKDFIESRYTIPRVGLSRNVITQISGPDLVSISLWTQVGQELNLMGCGPSYKIVRFSKMYAFDLMGVFFEPQIDIFYEIWFKVQRKESS